MPDYHPIDVRYKGPPTGYRGSVRRSDTGPTEAATLSPQRQGTSPWRGKLPATQQKAPARPAVAAAPRAASTARRTYYTLIGIVILFTLFGGPTGLFEVLGLAPTQMKSLR